MAEEEYTFDPDLLESDRTLGRLAVYVEEAGAKKGVRSETTLHPCPMCGVRIITGVLDNGTTITVESDVPMYTMLWQNRAKCPTLQVSRGYPAHQCRMTGG
jgi:hypothetical protein